MKMKSALIAVAVTTLTLAQQTHAKDACETVLCMAGMLQGVGVVSECSGAVNDYFSIIKTKHGKFSASRTASARGSYLNSCSQHSGWASKINSKYGKMRSFGL